MAKLNKFKDKRVLVTGGGGFIGSHLVEKLKEFGSEVFVIQKDIPKYSLDINFVKVNLCNKSQTCKVVKKIKPNIIFHLAGQIPQKGKHSLSSMLRNNLIGTINLLESLDKAGYEVFVNASTGAVYGNSKTPYKESYLPSPISYYGYSKLCSEIFCQMYHNMTGAPITTLRFSNVFGPRQQEFMFIPHIILSCLKGKNIEMTAGKQTKDFIYVKDVIDAYLRAATDKHAIGEVFNIASGKDFRVIDVAKKVIRLTKAHISVDNTLPYREDEIWDYSFDISKAKKKLNWYPQYSLEEGLIETINYYKRLKTPK